MNKNKWIVAVLLILFLCAAGINFGQNRHFTVPAMGMNPASETPAQKAREDEKWRLDQAARAALDAGDYATEEADAQQSIALGNDSGLAQELLAQALDDQGKTQEALQAYKTIADSGGTFPRDMVPYATLLLKSGQWTQAVTAYNKMLPYLPAGDLLQANSNFSPDSQQPATLAMFLHIAQGLTYWGDGGWGTHARHEEMMNELSQALQLQPNSALANYYYGFGWQLLGPAERTQFATTQKAKAALQKAVTLGKGDVKKAAQEALRGR